MEEVKIGFIGCGGNAIGHMRGISEIEGTRIVATCDLDEERTNNAAQTYDAKAYTEHRNMLDQEDLDAVYLSIPVFAHGEPEMDAIERGLPFFVEKPVARDMETARSVEEAVEKHNIMTCVGYQLRYCGSTEVTKETLKGKTVGMVVGKYWCGSGRGDAGGWVRQMAKSGGQIVEQATHTIDMMRYLIGEVKEVYAKYSSRQVHHIDCPDVYCLVFEFENGTLGSMSTTWAYDPVDWSHANVLDISYEQSLLHWNAGSVTITENREVVEKTKPDRSIDRVFVEAVRTRDGTEILSPYSDAVQSLAVSMAANTSAEKGCAERL